MPGGELHQVLLPPEKREGVYLFDSSFIGNTTQFSVLFSCELFHKAIKINCTSLTFFSDAFNRSSSWQAMKLIAHTECSSRFIELETALFTSRPKKSRRR